ncbi:MAG TPA: hypothetical protein VJN88_03275 [Ktedonobacterales bacterium]|nr:hypothetical protein [Ktedonobacterales bacterium]
MDDYTHGDWEPKLRLLLDYAVTLTLDTHAVGEENIQRLRTAGWSDEVILEAVEIVGFFNYYNRMVDGLGVAPEPEWGEVDAGESDT